MDPFSHPARMRAGVRKWPESKPNNPSQLTALFRSEVSMSVSTEPLREALTLIQDADTSLLGQRRPSQDLIAEIQAKHREAAILITRYLAEAV